MVMNRVYDPVVEEQAALFPAFDISKPTKSREQLSAFMSAIAAAGIERPSDRRVIETEHTIPGSTGTSDILVRIYQPQEQTQPRPRPRPRPKPRPAVINFHGGAFIMGDLEVDRSRCLALAAEGGAVVIDVDYRLAPEHPFPAGLEDGYATLQWVENHATNLKIDPSKIVISGGSAGGNLAAALTLMTRDRKGPDIAYQMLFYPVIDDRCETISMQQGTDTYVWTRQNSLDMWEQYLGSDRDNVSPYAAPARAKDLSGLPPAYIISCEHDPLRDEAILYAMQLMEAGVPVELHNYPGTIHGFDLATTAAVSTRAMEESLEAFKRWMTN